MNRPLVSVIMGTYNPDIKYLSAAVDSIIHQSFSSWELLIYDDGSEESCYMKIRQVALRDNRIRCFHSNMNYGLAHGLNECLKRANGKYIARMDDDDISLSDRLEQQYAFLNAHREYAWVGCEAILFDETGIWGKASRPEKPSVREFLYSSPFIHPSVMFRKDVLLRSGGYCESVLTSRCEDYELFMRLCSEGVRGYNIQKTLFKYRDSSKMLKRSMRYCCYEMLIRIQGFKKLGLLTLSSFPYVIKPLLVGIVAKCPYFAQKIRTNRTTGDHIVK